MPLQGNTFVEKMSSLDIIKNQHDKIMQSYRENSISANTENIFVSQQVTQLLDECWHLLHTNNDLINQRNEDSRDRELLIADIKDEIQKADFYKHKITEINVFLNAAYAVLEHTPNGNQQVINQAFSMSMELIKRANDLTQAQYKSFEVQSSPGVANASAAMSVNRVHIHQVKPSFKGTETGRISMSTPNHFEFPSNMPAAVALMIHKMSDAEAAQVWEWFDSNADADHEIIDFITQSHPKVKEELCGSEDDFDKEEISPLEHEFNNLRSTWFNYREANTIPTGKNCKAQEVQESYKYLVAYINKNFPNIKTASWCASDFLNVKFEDLATLNGEEDSRIAL